MWYTDELYSLLRLVLGLWLTVIALLFLAHHELPPSRRVHNVINIGLAVASLAECIAIAWIGVLLFAPYFG